MNKHFLLIPIFICIYASIFGQSAFVRSNSSTNKSVTAPVPVKADFGNSLDEIRNSMDKLSRISREGIGSTSVAAQIEMETLKRSVARSKANNLQIQNSVGSMQNMRNEAGRMLSQEWGKKKKNTQRIKGLEKTIAEYDNNLRTLLAEQAQGNADLQNLENSIEIVSRQLLESQIEALDLKHAKYSGGMEKLEASIEDLTKGVEKVSKSITDMKGNQNSGLADNDDSTIKQFCVAMGVEKGAAVAIVSGFKEPVKKIKDKLQELKVKIDAIKSVLSYPDLTNVPEALNSSIVAADELVKEINTAIETAGKDITTATDKLKTIEQNITQAQDKINEVYKKYPAAKNDKDNNLEAIGGITQPLGKMGQLVPGISLLGFNNKSDENSSLVSQLKLFVSTSKEEQATFNSNYKLFIPEMSNFGFTADFGFGFIPSTKSYKIDGEIKQPIKKLGINIGTYYLSKSLTMPKDSSEFNVGTLQFKAGLQYILIGKVLSIYSNINSFFITNGVDKFQQSFNYDKKLRSFVDFGLECYLELADRSKAGGLFIDFDLGFIVAGGDVKSLVPGNDPLIPRIKISLVKGFKF